MTNKSRLYFIKPMSSGGFPGFGGAPPAVGTANSAGASGLAAQSDHQHAHGDQLGGALHAIVDGVNAGFMSPGMLAALASLVSFPGFGLAPPSVGAANAAGSSGLAAQSDHEHAHGDQGGGSLHAVVTALSAGFMSPAMLAAINAVYEYDAYALWYPSGADWAINGYAAAQADSNNGALYVRAFLDSTEQGVGFLLDVPAGMTTLTLRLKSRAAVAPGVAANVALNLYTRQVPDNVAIGAWSAAYQVTQALAIPTNNRYQYDSYAIPLADIGVTAGNACLFELTRDTGDVADDLAGAWWLLLLQADFS